MNRGNAYRFGRLAGPLLLAVLAWFAAAGCRRGGQGAAELRPFESVHEADGCRVSLRADRTRLGSADRLRLSLAADVPEGADVRFPEFPGDPDGLSAASTDAGAPRLLSEGRVRREITFVLEPFLPGEFTVPALEIGVVSTTGAGAAETVIRTEAFPITVVSAFPDGGIPPEPAGDLEPEVPPRRVSRQAAAILAVTAAVAAVGALLWRRRRRTASPVAEQPRIPAHEVALAELRELLARGLPEAGRTEEFYREISGILRRYIERRFSIRAPEQTTEEFLAEVSRGSVFPADRRHLLEGFLSYCDLVKFARHHPRSEDIAATVSQCREFIEQTREAVPT